MIELENKLNKKNFLFFFFFLVYFSRSAFKELVQSVLKRKRAAFWRNDLKKKWCFLPQSFSRKAVLLPVKHSNIMSCLNKLTYFVAKINSKEGTINRKAI